MIVAIYVDPFALVLSVHPVNRIDELTPQDRRHEHAKQNHNTPSFASLLDAMMHVEDPDNEHAFDALA